MGKPRGAYRIHDHLLYKHSGLGLPLGYIAMARN